MRLAAKAVGVTGSILADHAKGASRQRFAAGTHLFPHRIEDNVARKVRFPEGNGIVVVRFVSEAPAR